MRLDDFFFPECLPSYLRGTNSDSGFFLTHSHEPVSTYPHVNLATNLRHTNRVNVMRGKRRMPQRHLHNLSKEPHAKILPYMTG